MHTPEANMRRMRRALEELYGLCGSVEARESLGVFQREIAGVSGCAELGRPVGGEGRGLVRLTMAAGTSGEGWDGGAEEEVRMSEMRKVSFMDRLLGRSRRSLVA